MKGDWLSAKRTHKGYWIIQLFGTMRKKTVKWVSVVVIKSQISRFYNSARERSWWLLYRNCNYLLLCVGGDMCPFQVHSLYVYSPIYSQSSSRSMRFSEANKIGGSMSFFDTFSNLFFGEWVFECLLQDEDAMSKWEDNGKRQLGRLAMKVGPGELIWSYGDFIYIYIIYIYIYMGISHIGHMILMILRSWEHIWGGIFGGYPMFRQSHMAISPEKAWYKVSIFLWDWIMNILRGMVVWWALDYYYGTVSFSLRLITLISKVPKLQYAIYRVSCVSIPKGLHVMGMACPAKAVSGRQKKKPFWSGAAPQEEMTWGLGRVNIMKSSKLIATGLHDGYLHSWDDPRFIRQAKTHSWNKERQTWLGRDCGKWVWGSPVCGGVEALDGHQHLGWIPGIMQFRNSEIDRRRKIQFFFFFGIFLVGDPCWCSA